MHLREQNTCMQVSCIKGNLLFVFNGFSGFSKGTFCRKASLWKGMTNQASLFSDPNWAYRDESRQFSVLLI